jgi:hypothetical protein
MAKTRRDGRQAYINRGTIYNKSCKPISSIGELLDTWSEQDICSRVWEFAVWGEMSPSSLGCTFVVFENRPITLGKYNCAHTSVKKFPIHQPVLPEA